MKVPGLQSYHNSVQHLLGPEIEATKDSDTEAKDDPSQPHSSSLKAQLNVVAFENMLEDMFYAKL